MTTRGEATSCPRTGNSYPESACRERATPLASEGIAVVDNVGRDDADINLSITREHLERLCKASVVDWLTSLIGRALCGKDEGYVASHSFDNSSLAFGASLVGDVDATIND